MSGTEVVIVGGGILGLAAAYKLLRSQPGVQVLVVEKEPEVGRHQSGHNSGVLHAGLSYEPGSAKARLAVDGIRQMIAYCRASSIPHEICGKLVIAADEAELPLLNTLVERGRRNGLRGLAWMGPDDIRAREPHAIGRAAVLVPEEGIVDYAAVCRSLAGDIRHLGGEVRTGFAVTRLERHATAWRLHGPAGTEEAGLLVNCAGLHSDRLARMAGVVTDLRIVPFRGQYHQLRPDRRHLVRHLIYPVPDARYPFLGVHLTRRIGGAVDAGPNALPALAREGYRAGHVNLGDMYDMATTRGLWRFLGAHRGLCSRELRLSLSRRRFAQAASRLVPEIQASDLEPAGAGVRAQAIRPDGALVNDFVFATGEAAVHLLNAPSPGATAALAIGDEVVRRIEPWLPRRRAAAVAQSGK